MANDDMDDIKYTLKPLKKVAAMQREIDDLVAMLLRLFEESEVQAHFHGASILTFRDGILIWELRALTDHVKLFIHHGEDGIGPPVVYDSDNGAQAIPLVFLVNVREGLQVFLDQLVANFPTMPDKLDLYRYAAALADRNSDVVQTGL